MKITAKVNDVVVPDEWIMGAHLMEDDGFKDSSFPGCQFRLPGCHYQMAVNIKVTGKPRWHNGQERSRCKIEFVGDGEPSEFSGGWIYPE